MTCPYKKQLLHRLPTQVSTILFIFLYSKLINYIINLLKTVKNAIIKRIFLFIHKFTLSNTDTST